MIFYFIINNHSTVIFIDYLIILKLYPKTFKKTIFIVLIILVFSNLIPEEK